MYYKNYLYKSYAITSAILYIITIAYVSVISPGILSYVCVGAALLIFMVAWYAVNVSIISMLFVMMAASIPFSNMPILRGVPYVGMTTVLTFMLMCISLGVLVGRGSGIHMPYPLYICISFAFIVIVGQIMLGVLDTSHAIEVTKRILGRAIVLTLSIVWTIHAVDVFSRRAMYENAVFLLIALGVLGSILSVFQVYAGVGYIVFVGQEYAIERYHGSRALGLAESPGTWGTFLLIPLSFAIMSYKNIKNIAINISVIAIMCGIMLTKSRSAIIGVVAIVVWWIFRGNVIISKMWRYVCASVFVVIVVVVAILYAYNPDTGTVVDRSVGDRIIIWYNAWYLFLDNMYIGVGMGNFETIMAQMCWYKDIPYDYHGDIIRSDVEAHNFYVDILVETGILGFTIFMAFLWSVWRGMSKYVRGVRDTRTRMLIYGIQGALIGVLSSGVGQDLEHHMALWWLLGVGLASCMLEPELPKDVICGIPLNDRKGEYMDCGDIAIHSS